MMDIEYSNVQIKGSMDLIADVQKYISKETFKTYRPRLLKLKPHVLDYITLLLGEKTSTFDRTPCVCIKKSKPHTYDTVHYCQCKLDSTVTNE